MQNRFLEPLEGRTHLSATIYGSVHNDVFPDGIVDENATIPAVSAYIDYNNNSRHDKFEPTAPINSLGRYSFTNLETGTYRVLLDIPKGFIATNAAARVGQTVHLYGNGSITIPTMMIHYSGAPWPSAGQNPQHTGISPFRAAPIDNQAAIATLNLDLTSTASVQYGSPVVTKLDTVIVPSVVNGQYTLTAYNWQGTGTPIWTYTSNYVPPPGASQAVFSPVLSKEGKLYFPGAAGQILVLSSADRPYTNKAGAITPKALFFYPEKKFRTNPSPYRSSLFINTPITLDAKGNLYFGVYSTGAANNPAGIGSSFVRMTPAGKSRTVSLSTTTGRAPAISNDGKYVYVPGFQNSTFSLLRFKTSNLTKAGSAALIDPVTQTLIALPSDSTASPVIGLDGDVYLTVPANDPATTADTNGWLLHFSADLKTTKGYAAAVADQTPSIVPASMVQDYAHAAAGKYFVLASKAIAEVDGAPLNQTLSLFNPTASDANGQMKKLDGGLTAISPGSSIPGEWVSNSVIVDPSSGSIYAVDFLEQVHRWNLSDSLSVTPPLALIPLDELTSVDTGHAPMAVGPEGEIYAIANNTLYVIV